MTGASLLDGTSHDDVVRVVVCDDHALMRRRLIVTLEEDPAMAVVAEAIDTQHLISVCREATPDCVIVGLKVEPDGAVIAAAGVRAVSPRSRVVVVVSRSDEAAALRAVAAGATGLITREALDQTVAVVRAVCSGVLAVPPLVARLLIEEMSRIDAASLAVTGTTTSPLLADRERAVLEHLAAGHSYRTAASALRLSDHTVRNLAANAAEKLVTHRLAEHPAEHPAEHASEHLAAATPTGDEPAAEPLGEISGGEGGPALRG